MAEILSVSTNPNYEQYESLRPLQWILEVGGIDAFICKTKDRPKKRYESNCFNNAKWMDFEIELLEPISPNAAISFLKKLEKFNLYQIVEEFNFKLKMLNRSGIVIESLSFFDTIPIKSINKLYSIKVVFRPKKCVLEFKND